MTSLNNKVAIITGATSGIGRAAARLFVAQGAAVVLGGRRKAEGDSLVEELRRAGGRAEFLATDVTRHADNLALVQLATERFGNVDIVFLNAGLESTGPLGEFNEVVYAQVFDTNVRSVFSGIQAALPALQKTRGTIIVTSSTAGSHGFAGASLYAASKHAVEGIVKSAALELAPLGIRVNAVAPGPTATTMLDRFTGGHPELMAARVPMGRNATVEEIGEAAVWLASQQARFVSGQVLGVDGGLTAG
jgi:NAD(P)-dependent dehydrogenase (short-subunit alcohol dehydrogenase family)